MEKLEKSLKEIWATKVYSQLKKGILVYERQLQAVLYCLLKKHLPKNYEVWLEPVINETHTELDKTKPDLIVTRDKNIIGIMELKFKPWEDVKYLGDIKKLMSFDKYSQKNPEIILGLIPKLSNSNEFIRDTYKLTSEHLSVFIVCCNKNSTALNLSKVEKPNNFIHFWGYINDSSIFSWTDYKN